MPQEGLDLSAGQAFADTVNVPASECRDGRMRVAPGKPEQSYLLDKVLNVDICSGTKMPKLGSLPDKEMETITNWICAGAPNN